MKLIPINLHAIMDYILCILYMASPWLFGFARGHEETWAPVNIGIWMLMYCLLTRYPLGLFKGFPIRVHIGLDLLTGTAMALSPLIFEFYGYVHLPHILLGAALILLGLLGIRRD